MNVPDFFVKTWESEMPAFGRVLRALPADKLDYRPHERSTAAGDLAWQLVIEQRALSDLAEKGENRWDMGAEAGSDRRDRRRLGRGHEQSAPASGRSR